MAFVFSVRPVQASRTTPSKAYLAMNAAHGLSAAFYACHGSPHFNNFGFPVVHRTSPSQENHQLSQVPKILFYPGCYLILSWWPLRIWGRATNSLLPFRAAI
eukprot:760576-Pleurochrysis_carterae.AAC.2